MSGINVHTISYTGAALSAALKVQQRVAEAGFDSHHFINEVSKHLKNQLDGSSDISGGNNIASHAEKTRPNVGAEQNSGRSFTV